MRPWIVDVQLTLLFKLGQGVFLFLLCLWSGPIPKLWLSANNRHSDSPGCRKESQWCSVDTHFQDGAGIVCLHLLRMKADRISQKNNDVSLFVFYDWQYGIWMRWLKERPELKNRRLDPMGQANASGIRRLMCTYPGLDREEVVGGALGLLCNQTPLSFQSQPPWDLGYLDALLILVITENDPEEETCGTRAVCIKTSLWICMRWIASKNHCNVIGWRHLSLR